MSHLCWNFGWNGKLSPTVSKLLPPGVPRWWWFGRGSGQRREPRKYWDGGKKKQKKTKHVFDICIPDHTTLKETLYSSPISKVRNFWIVCNNRIQGGGQVVHQRWCMWLLWHMSAFVYIYSLCLQKDGVLTPEMVSSCLSNMEHSVTGLKHSYHCLSLPVRHFHTHTGAPLKCITLNLYHVFIHGVVFAFKILGIVFLCRRIRISRTSPFYAIMFILRRWKCHRIKSKVTWSFSHSLFCFPFY